MSNEPTIVFVCEHGAAKSVIAAAHFNRLAGQAGLDLRAIARGTNPDPELSPQAVEGLSGDGLAPAEGIPQKLTEDDLRSSQRLVIFCELPSQYPQPAAIERWENIPSVNQDYEKARDAILARLMPLLEQM
jgi:protein-tyrosine-phosphatase